ncbi:hypothetical protein TrLO_g8143 [Triparma laevis f. longispina]|uniref:Uncharacterized protein n=1 Tax=Triparma laevis f. longispina TaxID=1714387 RepID=A0A9W7C8K6_9STRA|nr:hypothetical protein TrLO_g8143 [Triparma laevis f. longispina]
MKDITTDGDDLLPTVVDDAQRIRVASATSDLTVDYDSIPKKPCVGPSTSRAPQPCVADEIFRDRETGYNRAIASLDSPKERGKDHGPSTQVGINRLRVVDLEGREGWVSDRNRIKDGTSAGLVIVDLDAKTSQPRSANAGEETCLKRIKEASEQKVGVLEKKILRKKERITELKTRLEDAQQPEDLRAENANLRAEVETLKAENAMHKAAIGKLMGF